MSLVDPTSGAGYAFGAKLPATHMTTIATNQPKAVDGSGGGTYTPSAEIIVNGSGLQLGNRLKYTSRTATRVQEYAGNARSLSGNWSLYTNDAWRNTASGGVLWVNLNRIPNYAAFASITMRWKGAAGHAGQPGTMPKMELFKIDKDSARTSMGSVLDTWTNAAAYETAHDITLTLTDTIDLATYRYVLEITGELSPNFVSGAQPLGFLVTTTITQQSEV